MHSTALRQPLEQTQNPSSSLGYIFTHCPRTLTHVPSNYSLTRLSLFWKTINSFTEKKITKNSCPLVSSVFAHQKTGWEKNKEEFEVFEYLWQIWQRLTMDIHSPASFLSCYTTSWGLSTHRNPTSLALVGLFSKSSLNLSLAPWTSLFLNS